MHMTKSGFPKKKKKKKAGVYLGFKSALLKG